VADQRQINRVARRIIGAPPNHCMQPTPQPVNQICIRKVVACLARLMLAVSLECLQGQRRRGALLEQGS
jgi:hypothetical protein